MIARKCVWLCFLALLVAPTAEAAMCIRMSSDSQRPIVGHATTIRFATFYPTATGELKRWEVRGYPFRVEAISPRGRIFRIRVAPSRNPFVWAGAFRFKTPGTWVVRVRNPGLTPSECGPQLRLRVRPER